MVCRCGLVRRVSDVATVGFCLVLTSCAAGPDAPSDLLAFEPGEGPAQATFPNLGVDSPIRQICATPGGRALLDRKMPGLTTRPEYPMFSDLSLVQLKRLSAGRISARDLAEIAAGLRELTVAAESARTARSAIERTPTKLPTTAQAGP